MIDHTTISATDINKETGEIKSSETTKIYYKDVGDYDDLPGPCKCKKVKKELEEFKRINNTKGSPLEE